MIRAGWRRARIVFALLSAPLPTGCGPDSPEESVREMQGRQSKLKWFGYYHSGYHFPPGHRLEIGEFADHTNFIDVRAPLQWLSVPIEAAIANKQRVYLGIADDLVHKSGVIDFELKRDWRTIWSQKIKPVAQRYRSHILAIGGVDEADLRRMPIESLRTLYRQFKADFPKIPIFCNYMSYPSGYGASETIPDECDWLGFTPSYGRPDSADDYASLKKIVRDKQWRTGKAHKILFVGDGYAGWDCRQRKDCPNTQEALRVDKAKRTYEQALRENTDNDDVDTVGFFVFVWGTIRNEGGLGVRDQPDLLAQYRSIGRAIVDSSAHTTMPPMHGRIDEVDDVVRGWACIQGDDMAIDVDLYAGGPKGKGSRIGRARANQASGAAVKKACATAAGRRFSLVMSDRLRMQHGGQRIYAHGIRPGGPGTMLAKSGVYAVPTLSNSVTDAVALHVTLAARALGISFEHGFSDAATAFINVSSSPRRNNSGTLAKIDVVNVRLSPARRSYKTRTLASGRYFVQVVIDRRLPSGKVVRVTSAVVSIAL